MTRRLERLERIERLARRLSELAKWRLAEAVRARETLKSDHAAMIAALGEGWMAFGPPAIAGTRRIRAIEGALQGAEADARDLERRALEEARRVELAGRQVAEADAQSRSAAERRDLERLVEVAAGSVPRKS